MKKAKKLLLITAATILLIPMNTLLTVSAKTNVTIPDENLKTEVLSQLNKDSNYTITDEDLKAFKKLDISGKEISSLEGLEYCTNLTDLEAYNNNITDLSPISSLSSLEKLDIDYNQVKTLNSIASLNNLKELDANLCGISDISPLKTLPNIEYAYFSYNEISDISVVSALPNLKYIDLSEQTITLPSQKISKSKVALKYPIKDFTNNPDIRIYDISDNGTFNSNNNTVNWKNIKKNTELNFFFKEHIQVNGKDLGRIDGVINVPAVL